MLEIHPNKHNTLASAIIIETDQLFGQQAKKAQTNFAQNFSLYDVINEI